jgi:hypothetical protein
LKVEPPDHFINWTYGLVNYVRCISPFTGFDLMMWGRRDVPGQVDGVKAAALYGEFIGGTLSDRDLPGRLERDFSLSDLMRRTSPNMTAFYDSIVSTIRLLSYRRTPRGGEIGIRHNGRIINRDILYQRRLNALYGAVRLALKRPSKHGSANFSKSPATVSRPLAGGVLPGPSTSLIDLPLSGQQHAYLGCTSGPDSVAFSQDMTAVGSRSSSCRIPVRSTKTISRVPSGHNAISFNEMSAP